VKLSISLPQSSYPREALVRATVRLRNVSRAPVLVGSAPAAECAKIGPAAVVLAPDGTQVYPPAPLGGLMGSCGPYGLDDPWRLLHLLPGHTMTRHPYVILSGPTVEAVATYYGADSRATATSKPISVSLYDAPKPAFTLTTSPAVSATIASLPGAPAGGLRMVYQWLCPDEQNARGTGPMVKWLPAQPDAAGAYTFQPGCAQPFQWHVVAGFPNEPVVTIDYCRPSQWGC
jgi:hypothetical protein